MTRFRELISRILKNGETLRPSVNEEFRIQGGNINHVTGTDSIVIVTDRGPSTNYVPVAFVNSACASGVYALCPTLPDSSEYNLKRTSNVLHLWFDSHAYVLFAGDANAYTYVWIEKVTVDEMGYPKKTETTTSPAISVQKPQGIEPSKSFQWWS